MVYTTPSIHKRCYKIYHFNFVYILIFLILYYWTQIKIFSATFKQWSNTAVQLLYISKCKKYIEAVVSWNSLLALSFQIHRDCNKQLHISLKQVLHQCKTLQTMTQLCPKSEFDLSLKRTFTSLCEIYHHQAWSHVWDGWSVKRSY